MIVHGVLMQTMGGADPPAIPPPPTGGDLPPLPPSLGSTLTQEICEKADRDAYLALGGYALGAVLLGLILFAVFHKKLVGGSNLQRILMAATIASIAGAALVWFDPARADVYLRCLNSTQFALYLTLGSQPLGRALAIGFAPAFGLTALLSFVYSKIK